MSVQIQENIYDTLLNLGYSLSEAESNATARTSEVMDNLAALHNPDMIAAGRDEITRLGDTRVNSAIGGSWGDSQNPNSRIARIDAAAQAAADDPNIGRNSKMNTKLEPCRGRKP